MMGVPRGGLSSPGTLPYHHRAQKATGSRTLTPIDPVIGPSPPGEKECAPYSAGSGAFSPPPGFFDTITGATFESSSSSMWQVMT